MKLAAIYNVWDGVELLQGSMNCLKNHVDLFIIVYQTTSNFGEKDNPLPEISKISFENCLLVKYNPEIISGSKNEKNKRNIGLEIAKQYNCTHFLHMDCDEYYHDFGNAKQQYINSGHNGSVCKIFTYFKKPTLRFEDEDCYYVPFIHELKKDTEAGVKKYPFYVDPTRRINETDVVLLHIHMHHFSYIRNNIERKIRNSTAKVNIQNSNLLKDYYSPDLKEGYHVKDIFNQKLIEVPDTFNIITNLNQ